METSTMIRQLRRTAKKHENDKLHTFDTNITAMCLDVANRLEELEKENKEIRNNAIDDFFEVLQKYEESDGWLRLKMLSIYEIAEQLRAGEKDG